MNPRDFLSLAEALITELSEADWRTAVSRGYYAAFHVARELLEACGFVVPRADQAHAYLQLRLVNCGHADVGEAGRDLGDLRRLRNHADYDLDQPFPHAEANRFVLLAGDVIRLLELAATEPTVRVRITDGMKDYERDVLKTVTWQP
jgi:uncharacterized protein (UPF0332 family)